MLTPLRIVPSPEAIAPGSCARTDFILPPSRPAGVQAPLTMTIRPLGKGFSFDLGGLMEAQERLLERGPLSRRSRLIEGRFLWARYEIGTGRVLGIPLFGILRTVGSPRR